MCEDDIDIDELFDNIPFHKVEDVKIILDTLEAEEEIEILEKRTSKVLESIHYQAMMILFGEDFR